MSKSNPPTDRPTNRHVYSAALGRRGLLLIWLYPEIQWLVAPTGKPGRQPVFTDTRSRPA
jgi:hypothetical protein